MKYIRGAIALGCMFKAQISKKSSWLFQQGCAKHGSGNGKVCALMSVFKYRDVPFENVRNGIERILLACTYSGDSYKAIETCTNMNEIKDCITTLGYYGVNTNLNPNYTYIYFWRPCISLIYEVCQDIMLIDIDNTIGTFYRTDLDPKGESIFLRAYEAMKCRNVPFGK